MTSSISTDNNFIIIFISIAILAFVLRLFVSKAKNVNRPLLVIAIYAVAICLILCLISTRLGIFRIYTTGNPTAVVNSFYTNILNKNYSDAYSLLNNCSGLGLEQETMLDDKLANALEKSYSYSLSENAVINGLSATQKVSFTSLDVAAISAEVSTYIEPLLNEKIDSLPKSELYTEDGHYNAELMNEIYDEALNKALKHVTDYYVTTEYDVSLEYKDGNWYLNTNDEIISGFLGEM